MVAMVVHRGRMSIIIGENVYRLRTCLLMDGKIWLLIDRSFHSPFFVL